VAADVTLLVALGSIWGITATGRMVGDPPALLIAAVTFLPFLYVTAGATAFVAWCVWSDRRIPPVILALTVMSGGFLWGPSWPTHGAQVTGEPMRVMEWNVQRLWGLDEDKVRGLNCVADVVEENNPDTIVFLEVSATDIGQLKARLQMQCVHTDYRASGRADVGGLAVCTRGETWTLRNGSAQPYIDGDDWRYVFAEVQRGESIVNVLAVHLYPYRFGESLRRLAQGDPGSLQDLQRTGEAVTRAQGAHTVALQRRVERLSDPTIMAGDFNSTRDAALHATLRKHMTDAWEQGGHGMGATIRIADALPLRIDYVYVTSQLVVEGSKVIQTDCSDHRPVLTRLNLTTQSAVP